MINYLIIGFLIGSLCGGFYAAWFTRMLIKKGWAIFEMTDKFRKEFNIKKKNENICRSCYYSK